MQNSRGYAVFLFMVSEFRGNRILKKQHVYIFKINNTPAIMPKTWIMVLL